MTTKPKTTSNCSAMENRIQNAERLSQGKRWVMRYLYWCVLRNPRWTDAEFAYVYGRSPSSMRNIRKEATESLFCG